METTEPAISLGVQIAVAGGFVLLMTILHALGLVGISRSLGLNREQLRKREFDARAVLLLASLGLSLFALHIAEILIFAIFYLQVEAVKSVGDALHYSASAYATLGQTEYFPSEWRLIGSLEALIGFLLIGWSTAFMVSTMGRLRD